MNARASETSIVTAPAARATSLTPSSRTRSCAPAGNKPMSTSAELGDSKTNARASLPPTRARSNGVKPVPRTLSFPASKLPLLMRISSRDTVACDTDSMRGAVGLNSR